VNTFCLLLGAIPKISLSLRFFYHSGTVTTFNWGHFAVTRYKNYLLNAYFILRLTMSVCASFHYTTSVSLRYLVICEVVKYSHSQLWNKWYTFQYATAEYNFLTTRVYDLARSRQSM